MSPGNLPPAPRPSSESTKASADARSGKSSNQEDIDEEISTLICQLHQTSQRLEELTAWEVDTVADREGRTFLLQHAQEQLRHNEAEKRASILNALPAHIALLDTQGIIVSVNDAWRRFGEANDGAGSGVAGLNYLEICDASTGQDSSSAHSVADGIRSVLGGAAKSFSIEYACHSPTEQRWFLLIVTPLANDRPSGVIVMHVDVTQERQAEEGLRASELRFRQIAENIQDVFFLQNLDGSQIYYVSPAYEKIWGRTCESLYANPKSWADSIHSDDLHVAFTSVDELQDSNRGYDFRIVRPDGETRWIHIRGFLILDTAGNAYRVAGIASDVTERKQALDEMHESGRRFSDLLRNVELASVMLDLEARITYCNEYLLRLTGWTIDEVVGRSWFDIFMPPELGDMRPMFAALLANLPEAWHQENEIFTRSRERRLVRWNNSVLRSGDGQVIGTASIGEDITEQKRAEVRIKRLNRVYVVLSQINALIARVQNRDELFREASRIAVGHGRFRMAWIGVVDKDAGVVKPIASAGDVGDFFDSVPLALVEIRPGGRSLVGRAVREMKPKISNDVRHDSRLIMTRQLGERGINSLAIIPLIFAGEAIGVLCLYSMEAGFFDEEEMRLLVGLGGDISFAIDHIDKQERLTYLAYYDPLTGLANRRLFLELLQQSTSNASVSRNRIGLVLLDIERFTTINNTLGRAAGDAVLKELAKRLSAHASATSRLSRIEADHFAIIVPDIANEAELAHRIEAGIAGVFGKPFLIGDSELRISVKAGIAMFPDDGMDAEMLFRNVEAALKSAKAIGNRYLFYTQGMNERIAEKLALENQLRLAIENNEFLLYYQPKVELRSGRIVGFEALLRWQRPGHALESPREFLAVLEETGLIVRVGNWVVDQACRQMGLWMHSSIGPVQVSVNVAGHQFIDGNLESEVIRALEDNDVSADQLELELTESSLMANTERNIAALRNLKKRGVRISIDDFGTGYSSLAYLRHFPVDKLKIDIAFIRDVTSNPDDASIVQAIIRMAHSLKLEVVAEGVETAGQLAYLRRQGCDQIQGYYFSPALPVVEVEKMLRAEKRLTDADSDDREPHKTLLLVDDEPSVLTSLRRLLHQDGYRILSAQSAAEGFELLAQHSVQVILCDQRMPLMNGTVFLDRVKDLYPATLRIVLSGYTDLESIIEATNRGAVYRFYTKPWDNKILRDNIREAFRYHELLNARSDELDIANPASNHRDPTQRDNDSGAKTAN